MYVNANVFPIQKFYQIPTMDSRQENEDFADEEPHEPILGYYCTALLENVIDAGHRH